MKNFKDKITLIQNSRGCWILDTIKGCSIVNAMPGGCYHDCYASKIADRYGWDFGTTVKREFEVDSAQGMLFDFEDETHLNEIIRAIRKIEMPFIRIGEMGDPSWDWEHTIAVCEKIKAAGKPIVIITKHWTAIPPHLLEKLKGICINTSASALDESGELAYRVGEYERLKPYCKSVLRIVSCDFNLENNEGRARAKIQEYLFTKERTLDTVFRPSPSNPFLVNGVIKAEKAQFLKVKMLASIHNPQTYFGRCETCPDMCGVRLTSKLLERLK